MTKRQLELADVIHARVEAGAAWLPTRFGDDWFDRVRLHALELSNGSCCVIGQLEPGNFSHLFFTDKEFRKRASDYGFVCPQVIRDNPREACAYYRILTRAWREKIEKLRANAGTI